MERSAVHPAWPCCWQDTRRRYPQPGGSSVRWQTYRREHQRRPRAHPQSGCHQGRVYWWKLPYQPQLRPQCHLCADLHDEPVVSNHITRLEDFLANQDHSKYKGTKVDWDVDECVQPLAPQPVVKPRKEITPPKKTATAPTNRFQLLVLDEDEDDEISSAFQSKKSVGITA